MKHIVVVGKYYPPVFGGVERYAYDVARIAAKEHRVTVLVHDQGPDDRVEKADNVTVIRCGTKRIVKAQPISPSMFGHFRSLRPDLVQFNAPNFWAAAVVLLSGYKGPLMVTHHADVFGRPLLRRAVMPIYRSLVGRAGCVAVNSLKNGFASRDLPKSAGPLVAIPHGVDHTIYSVTKSDREKAMAERRRLAGDAPVVGFVGRFVRYKGLPVIVEAMSRLQGVHALMIGDGPLRKQIEKSARAAGLSERMHFLGNVDETTKIRLLSVMDLLLLPSTDTTESFGVIQIEAQLMEIPVIASHLPTGVTDVTIDGETGILVPPGDPDALGRAIARLLDDRDLASGLGRAGRAHALRHFTFGTFEQRFEQLFEALLAGRRIEGPLKSFASGSEGGEQTWPQAGYGKPETQPLE
jgi:glycosyltransferase involved in cell wall biosynthesis